MLVSVILITCILVNMNLNSFFTKTKIINSLIAASNTSCLMYYIRNCSFYIYFVVAFQEKVTSAQRWVRSANRANVFRFYHTRALCVVPRVSTTITCGLCTTRTRYGLALIILMEGENIWKHYIMWRDRWKNTYCLWKMYDGILSTWRRKLFRNWSTTLLLGIKTMLWCL